MKKYCQLRTETGMLLPYILFLAAFVVVIAVSVSPLIANRSQSLSIWIDQLENEQLHQMAVSKFEKELLSDLPLDTEEIKLETPHGDALLTFERTDNTLIATYSLIPNNKLRAAAFIKKYPIHE